MARPRSRTSATRRATRTPLTANDFGAGAVSTAAAAAASVRPAGARSPPAPGEDDVASPPAARRHGQRHDLASQRQRARRRRHDAERIAFAELDPRRHRERLLPRAAVTARAETGPLELGADVERGPLGAR